VFERGKTVHGLDRAATVISVAWPNLYLACNVLRILAILELHYELHLSMQNKHVSSLLKMSSSLRSNESIVFSNIAHIMFVWNLILKHDFSYL
jgi:hypothetical protein